MYSLLANVGLASTCLFALPSVRQCHMSLSSWECQSFYTFLVANLSAGVVTLKA